MSELYLEHYGVKGMKWGVRRAEKYRQNQIRRLDRTYNEKRNQRRVDRAQRKFDKTMAKEYVPSRKREAVTNRLTRAKAKQYYQRGMKKAEASALKKMSIDDINEEKSKVGRARVQSAATTLMVYAATGGRIRVIPKMQAREIRTENRVSEQDRKKLWNESYNKASSKK